MRQLVRSALVQIIASRLFGAKPLTDQNTKLYMLENASEYNACYYNDVIMGAMASQSPASPLFTQPFIEAQIKENIETPRQWPLRGEFPAQTARNAENVSIWWRHHDENGGHFVQGEMR